MNITAFDIAQRFVGMKEIAGEMTNPLILAMLKLDSNWPEDDEVPWCAAFVNFVTWILRLPRSKSLLARSWLHVGKEIGLPNAKAGFDIVILKRGSGDQPGSENSTAPGHVGFYAGQQGNFVQLLGGNQSDSVKVSSYDISRILSVRRLI